MRKHIPLLIVPAISALLVFRFHRYMSGFRTRMTLGMSVTELHRFAGTPNRIVRRGEPLQRARRSYTGPNATGVVQSSAAANKNFIKILHEVCMNSHPILNLSTQKFGLHEDEILRSNPLILPITLHITTRRLARRHVGESLIDSNHPL